MEELGVPHIDCQPYSHVTDAAATTALPLPDHTAPAPHYAGCVFFEKTTRACYLVDGLSDEGDDDIIIHTKIGPKQYGAIESYFLPDFRRLIVAGDFVIIGRGEVALLYCREQLRGRQTLQPWNRARAKHLMEFTRFTTRLKTTTYPRGLHSRETSGTMLDLQKYRCGYESIFDLYIFNIWLWKHHKSNGGRPPDILGNLFFDFYIKINDISLKRTPNHT